MSPQSPLRMLSAADPHALALSIRASCLVFEDPKSQALLARVHRIAPSEATVLVIGETGTGKELIARHIHDLSGRQNGPFLGVNCAALSESLVESELFGHERGAFTGAVTAKSGWFEAAQGGTLFLDEIGDLPLPMQVKLLRVVQEREVVRVGSRRPIPVNVRLIAATNVNLDEAVAAGRFREDLYYRLNVATVHLPPLRERPGDIPALASRFLKTYGTRLGHPARDIMQEATEHLLAYPWPGNIRELENVIHHALLVCPGSVLRPEDLRLPASRPRTPATPASNSSSTSSLEEALHSLFDAHVPNLYQHIDEAVIRTAYDYCEGNQVRTARLLGTSRNIVRDRLIRYGLLSA